MNVSVSFVSQLNEYIENFVQRFNYCLMRRALFGEKLIMTWTRQFYHPSVKTKEETEETFSVFNQSYDDIIVYISYFLNFFDLTNRFGIVNKNVYFICFKSKYKYNIAKQQYFNIISQLINDFQNKFKMSKDIKQLLLHRYNENYEKYKHYHILAEPETRNLFFTKYTNVKQIEQQFVQLSQSLIDIVNRCITIVDELKYSTSMQHNLINDTIILLRKVVKQMKINEKSSVKNNVCYLNIMIFFDILFHFKRRGLIKQSDASPLHSLLGVLMREMTQNYEYHAIWRWFCFVSDYEYDPYLRGSIHKDGYWRVQLGLVASVGVLYLPCREFVGVKPPIKPIPVSFARDIAYFSILGGKNCVKMPIEWRLDFFNGSTLATVPSELGKLVKFSPQTYQHTVD